MNKKSNKFLTTAIALMFCALPIFAMELDTSVDEEIRKNYNPSKLEMENLPPLPKTAPVTPIAPTTQTTSVQKINLPQVPTQDLTEPVKDFITSNFDDTTSIKIRKGTKFRVKSYQTVSDSTPRGTKITFVSQNSVTQRYVTIPQGTIFKGIVTDSHLPQEAGNGGLIVLSINQMNFRGSNVKINAKITKANNKKIFFNNIKGKRTYAKSMAKSTQPGKKFYKKMAKTTAKLANGNGTILLTPFTLATGIVGYGANIICSPVLAIFSTGGRISIPAGSDFEIKILDDVFLN